MWLGSDGVEGEIGQKLEEELNLTFKKVEVKIFHFYYFSKIMKILIKVETITK